MFCGFASSFAETASYSLCADAVNDISLNFPPLSEVYLFISSVGGVWSSAKTTDSLHVICEAENSTDNTSVTRVFYLYT